MKLFISFGVEFSYYVLKKNDDPPMAIFVNNNQKNRTIVSLQVSTLSYQSKSVTKCLKFVNEGTTRYIHARIQTHPSFPLQCQLVFGYHYLLLSSAWYIQFMIPDKMPHKENNWIMSKNDQVTRK